MDKEIRTWFLRRIQYAVLLQKLSREMNDITAEKEWQDVCNSTIDAAVKRGIRKSTINKAIQSVLDKDTF